MVDAADTTMYIRAMLGNGLSAVTESGFASGWEFEGDSAQKPGVGATRLPWERGFHAQPNSEGVVARPIPAGGILEPPRPSPLPRGRERLVSPRKPRPARPSRPRAGRRNPLGICGARASAFGTRQDKWSSVQSSEARYLYDGMLVVQERDKNNVPKVSYTRGLDLSGSRQGAGGIGGLLARSEHGTSAPYAISRTDCYHADGNGNLTALHSTNAVLSASYQYDPYGNVMSSDGDLKDANVYRFSSKMFHANSGLYYYGYRFYDPNLQRWPNRDPLEQAESSQGPNLFTFVGNEPVGRLDPDGREAGFDYPSCGCMVPPAPPADLGAGFEGAVKACVAWGSVVGFERCVVAKLRGPLGTCKNLRCKVAVHPNHHTFPVIGKKSHVPITCWVKGVKGSSMNIRIPIPDRFYP